MAGTKKKDTETEPVYPDQDLYIMSELDQVRVLSDPLRVRILEGLCQERTTKQVAESIGEKPTKLYHHVEALERVGLIKMTRTKQNRGTLEKYFLAVAKMFRADPELFAAASPGDAETEVMQAVAGTALEKTAAELRHAIAGGRTDLEADGRLVCAHVKAPLKAIQHVREQIDNLLADLVKLDELYKDDDTPDHDFRMTLAFFPLRDDS